MYMAIDLQYKTSAPREYETRALEDALVRINKLRGKIINIWEGYAIIEVPEDVTPVEQGDEIKPRGWFAVSNRKPPIKDVQYEVGIPANDGYRPPNSEVRVLSFGQYFVFRAVYKGQGAKGQALWQIRESHWKNGKLVAESYDFHQGNRITIWREIDGQTDKAPPPQEKSVEDINRWKDVNENLPDKSLEVYEVLLDSQTNLDNPLENNRIQTLYACLGGSGIYWKGCAVFMLYEGKPFWFSYKTKMQPVTGVKYWREVQNEAVPTKQD